MGDFLRILGFLRPHRDRILAGLLCLLFTTAAGIFYPLAWRFIVDEAVVPKDPGPLLPALAVMASVMILSAAASAVRDYLLETTGQRFILDLRTRLHDKLLSLPVGYFHDRFTGDLIARLVGDVNALEQVVIDGTDRILSGFLTMAGVAACLVVLQWKLGLATLAPALIVFLLLWRFNLKVRRIYRDQRDILGDVTARVQEDVAGIQVIKAFAREDEAQDRLLATSKVYYDAMIRGTMMRVLFYPWIGIVPSLGNVIMIGFGGWLAIRGEFTIGGIVAYRGFWWHLFGPIQHLSNINDLIQRARAAAARVFEVLDQPDAVADPPDARPLEVARGAIAFENVSFAYPGRPPVLSDFSLNVAPGQRVALVGSSGAGKSTALSLLLRFYDPQEGRVRIDGTDLKEAEQRSFRRRIGVVLQDTFLFNATVLENIRWGRPGATEEEVQAAACAANAHDFIRALPEGYATLVGERGVKLSGGQRQRIGIARAFLSDPRILVLDEATSAVEPESERAIQAALDQLMAGRTTLIVSHRLSMIKEADRIAVIEGGRKVEEGTHEELMEADGPYARRYGKEETPCPLP